MSVEVYSECAIQVDQSSLQFRRCLIELRQLDIGKYALRAIDLTNKNAEIFNAELIRRQQYSFAPSADQPDVFDTDRGRYHLRLNNTSRDIFQKILRTCLEEFLIVNDDPVTSTNALLQELSIQADEPFYSNTDPFDCITCMNTIEKGQGLLIRQCLHPLCKECLIQMIETSTEPTVQCPHDDCSMLIEERELRGVVRDQKVDEKIVDRLLDVGMRFAESRSKTFHCLTPDCPRWWFIEPQDANSLIFCRGCQHWLCLACTAIHEGQTCQEYQAAKLREINEGNVQKDNQHLEEMLKNKEILACPGCRVFIQKISGCDWIQCSQCKLEICWPTRGPRWGPGGRGDTSGGCRCRADHGKLCVPNCGNCH